MATKQLGRGLEALLVNMPNELGCTPPVESVERKQLQQECTHLLQEAEHLKSLLDTFEQFVLQLDNLQNQTL